MAAWDVFFPLVLVHVPAAPDPLVEQALRLATRELCERARPWRAWLACVETAPGSGVYTITLPTDSQALRLEAVTVDGRPLEVVPFTWHERDWEAYPTQQQNGVTTDDLATMTVTGQSITGTVKAWVSLMPTLEAATAPDFLASRYREGIAAGAARNLLLTRGAPWYDPNAAVVPAAAFETAAGRASVDMARAHTGRFRRPAATWF